MTKDWLEESIGGQPRMYRIEDEGYDGHVQDPSSVDEVVAKKSQAVERSYEWGDRIPTGVFYQARMRTYEEELESRLPSYGTIPLVDWDVEHRDVTRLTDALR
jgi:hypothetical protein